MLKLAMAPSWPLPLLSDPPAYKYGPVEHNLVWYNLARELDGKGLPGRAVRAPLLGLIRQPSTLPASMSYKYWPEKSKARLFKVVASTKPVDVRAPEDLLIRYEVRLPGTRSRLYLAKRKFPLGSMPIHGGMTLLESFNGNGEPCIGTRLPLD